MSHYSSLTVAGILCLMTILPGRGNCECPSYAHTTTVSGVAADLPDGWMIFAKAGTNGLFKCSIRSYSETIIPNTSSERPSWTDISPDGQWILYLATSSQGGNKIYLIKPDGTSKTTVPVTTDWQKYTALPRMPRFYYGSPIGNEIAYVSGSGRLKSIIWNVQGDSVTFGNERVLFSFGATDSLPTDTNGYQWDGWFSTNEGLGIWKDQILAEVWPNGDYVCSTPAYITIPSDGVGTASRNDFFPWTTLLDTATWGCGHSMSHDGKYCLSNSGWIGDTCVPNKLTGMDHKGFYITNFLKHDNPPIDIFTIPEVYGVSTNWCPESYRYGTYSQVGFNGWLFSNDTGYVIGCQEGTGTSKQPALKGIWIVHWPTNTWTLVSPDNNTASYVRPALWFPGIIGVKDTPKQNLHGAVQSSGRPVALSGRRTATVDLPNGVRGLSVYSMAGKLLWHYDRSAASGTQRVTLPQSMRSDGCIVTVFTKK